MATGKGFVGVVGFSREGMDGSCPPAMMTGMGFVGVGRLLLAGCDAILSPDGDSSSGPPPSRVTEVGPVITGLTRLLASHESGWSKGTVFIQWDQGSRSFPRRCRTRCFVCTIRCRVHYTWGSSKRIEKDSTSRGLIQAHDGLDVS